jgi:TolB protein
MLYTDQAGQIGRSAYMPDGAAILFGLAPDLPGAAKIYRLDLASGEVGEVPGMPEQSYDPAVSPDGRLVAFTARHGGGTDLFVLSLADGVSTQVTNLGAARAPAFSPDGGQLAFLASPKGERGFDLWAVDLKPTGGTPSFDEPKRISFDLGIDPDSGLTWGK